MTVYQISANAAFTASRGTGDERKSLASLESGPCYFLASYPPFPGGHPLFHQVFMQDDNTSHSRLEKENRGLNLASIVCLGVVWMYKDECALHRIVMTITNGFPRGDGRGVRGAGPKTIVNAK